MPSARDPLDGIALLLVDATNVLHAATRGRDPAPAATIVGRLRGAIPPTVRIELVFDGPPERGMRGTRIASGVTVRYAGRVSADAAILERLGSGGGPAMPGALESASILVVTDDRALGASARAAGARSASSAWLIERLSRGRLLSPAAGNPRPPGPRPPMPGSAGADDEADAPRWRPGRGATTKRGNPRRQPRRRPC